MTQSFRVKTPFLRRSIAPLIFAFLATFTLATTKLTSAHSLPFHQLTPDATLAAAVRAADQFSVPGEFEPIDALWMAYPVMQNIQNRPSEDVQAAMIRAVTPAVTVDLLVQNAAEANTVKQWLTTNHLPLDRVRLHEVPHTDLWMRDMGPIFLNDRTGKRQIADFGFDAWSYFKPTDELVMIDEAVDRRIARDLNLPTQRSSLVSEGGNHEFNGKGTMIATESVELQRNPTMSKAEITAEFKRVFNVKQVIWLKQGLLDDDSSFKGKLPGNVFTALTTGGHIDEFARFVDARTILLAEVPKADRQADRIAQVTSDRMEENYRILQTATDQDGQPFKIIRVPTAMPIVVTMQAQDATFDGLKELTFEDGTVIAPDSKIQVILAASYLNFVIANNVVLVPQYWQPDRPEAMRRRDETVKRLIQKALPNRTIVQINPENLNAGGGGMHCIVQQMPKV
jgi:agmatine deiminase